MEQSRFDRALTALRNLFRRMRTRDRKRKNPEPQDPYAYVMAPKKPRNPSRSGAAVAELPEE